MFWLFPQFPVKGRYQEDWVQYFDDELKERRTRYRMVTGVRKKGTTGIKISQLEDNVAYHREWYRLRKSKKLKLDYFTDIAKSVEWELDQLQGVMNLIENNDTLFFWDVDFPGFAQVFIQTLKLRKKIKAYGFLHAGSYIKRDIFSNTPGKRFCEEGLFRDFDGVFVATEYHKKKLTQVIGGGGKLYVVGAPFYRKYLPPVNVGDRECDVIHTGRLDKQKTDKSFLEIVESLVDVKFLSTRPVSKSLSNLSVIVPKDRNQYYDLLSRSCIYLNTSEEDTFSYGTVEAIAMGCIPLVPNHSSFPEIVGDNKFMYHDEIQLKLKISDFLNNIKDKKFPDLPDVTRFEQSIPKMIRIMLGDY